MNYSDIAKSKIGLGKVENIQFSAVDGLISGYGLVDGGSDLQYVVEKGVRSSELEVAEDASELHDFTASKDTYVYITLSSGAKVYTELDNGEAEPTTQDGDIYIGLVVTDDTVVTSATNAIIGYVKSIANEIGVAGLKSSGNPLTSNTNITLTEDYTIPTGESRIVSSLDTNGHTLTVDGELMDISAMNAELLDEVRAEYDPQLDAKQSILQSSYTQLDDATLDTGTHTFDYALGDYQQLTVEGDITLAFSNFVSGKVCSFVVELIAGGDYTITYPDGVEFDSGTAPELTSGTDVLGVVNDKDDVLSIYVIALDKKVVA